MESPFTRVPRRGGRRAWRLGVVSRVRSARRSIIMEARVCTSNSVGPKVETMRRFLPAAAVLAAICLLQPALAAPRSALIPQPEAARHGLVRAWYAQVQLDAGRARVRHIVLDRGTLFVQTDRAVLQAIDAETGETLWARIVGNPRHPSLEPGPGPDMVGVVNGSRLFVLNRHNGDILFETRVDGAPGAGPGLSAERAYVPMTSGMIMAYRLQSVVDPLRELGRVPAAGDEEKDAAAAEEIRRQEIRVRQEYIPPLASRSHGRAMVPPRVTWQSAEEEFVTWPTDIGYLYVGRVDRRSEEMLEVRYRLQTVGAVSTQPAYRPPDPARIGDVGTIFFVSEDGDVRAVQERSGEILWRFTTGEPTFQPPVLVGDRIYVANQFGGLHCLDANLGSEAWFSPGIAQFVAAGKERLYAVDVLGNLQVLYARTGMRLDAFSVLGQPIRLTNSATDRIYLATETGLVQCLREIEQTQPLVYHREIGQRVEPVRDPAAPPPAPGAPPARPPAPPVREEDDPFRRQPDPFGGAEEDPFRAPGGGAPAQEPDPFGGGAS
jgi:hypothetical protein